MVYTVERRKQFQAGTGDVRLTVALGPGIGATHAQEIVTTFAGILAVL